MDRVVMHASAPPDVLCIGESMVLVTPTDASPLRFGSQMTLDVAGAESNVALNLSALGASSAWASLVGDDRFGTMIIDHLAAAGVDVSLAEVRPGRTGVLFKDPSPVGTRVIYYRDGSAASRMTPSDVRAWAASMKPRIVHISGITSLLSPSSRALTDAVVKDRVFGDALVSFDVNHRPALARPGSAEQLLDLARAADIVFVGADEAEALWDVEKNGVAELVRREGTGPRHLIVKDGAVDATEHGDSGVAVAPALVVDVVEPVGAGDAFAAGWLAGLLGSLDAPARLSRGHAAACAVLGSSSDTAAHSRGSLSGAGAR